MSRVANGQKKITEMQKHLTAKHYKDLQILLMEFRATKAIEHNPGSAEVV